MTTRRPPSIVSQTADPHALAAKLTSIVEAQEQVWQEAAAAGQGPDTSIPRLQELEAEFREVVRELGVTIEPPLPLSVFHGWIWEAAAWSPERVARSTSRKRARVDALVAELTGEPRWEVIPFEDGQASFMGDTRRLDKQDFDALEAALERVLAVHGSALLGTKWMHKTVDGDGIYEFRIDNDLDQIERRTSDWAVDDPLDDQPEEWLDQEEDKEEEGGPRGEDTDVLIRVFFIFDGRRVIVLLHTYDKGNDDSDKRENRAIAEAKARKNRYRRAGGRRG